PIPHPIGGALVTFSGTWTEAEKAVVYAGAMQVAQTLFLDGGEQFNSPREAFMAVYGHAVEFRKTGISADNLGEAKRDHTTGQHFIEVNERRGATVTSEGTMWVAHELGHAFNNALSPNQTEPTYTHGQGLIDLAQEGI